VEPDKLEEKHGGKVRPSEGKSRRKKHSRKDIASYTSDDHAAMFEISKTPDAKGVRRGFSEAKRREEGTEKYSREEKSNLLLLGVRAEGEEEMRARLWRA